MDTILGKVPLDKILKTIGTKKLELDSNEIFGDYLATVNPAIGVPDEFLGFFAYHYAATNIAVSFARPEYALLDLNFPEGYPDDTIEKIMKDFLRECEKYGTRLIGGHTARYRGIEWPIASTTIIGKRVRERERPSPGDTVLLIGEVGLETAWLMGEKIDPRTLTPLPTAIQLTSAPGLKLLHDVSEGGVYRAIEDIAQAYSVAIDISSNEIPLYPGFPSGLDPLTSPSYGTLIAIANSPPGLLSYCSEKGIKCKEIGKVFARDTTQVLIDGKPQKPRQTLPVETLYSPSLLEKDESMLKLAAESLARILYQNSLLPETGTNIAYLPRDTDNPREVLALDGRIIKTKSGPKICGKPAPGGSTYLAKLLIEAKRSGLPYRAAINLRYKKELVEKLEQAGIQVYDASSHEDPCPVVGAIRAGNRAQAYFYKDKPNLEPTLVILGEDPLKLANMIRRLLVENPLQP